MRRGAVNGRQGPVQLARKQGDSHVCPSCDRASFQVIGVGVKDHLFQFVVRCRFCGAWLSYEKKL